MSVRVKKVVLVAFQKTNCVCRFRDCSLFIGSTGPVFWGTGQGLFLMLLSTGHKDFLCFYGTGHELFLEKSLKLYLYNISGW